MVGPLVPHWTPVVSCQADAGAALLRAVFAQDPTPIRDAELWKTRDIRGFHTYPQNGQNGWFMMEKPPTENWMI